MKAVCIKTYYDKKLMRTVGKGEELELSEERFKELSTTSNDAKAALVKKAEEKTAKTSLIEKKG